MMKLVGINVYDVPLPVLGAYKMATSSMALLQSTVVELITDEGITGFGETCPLGPVYQPQHVLGARAAIQEIAPSIIGIDPRNIGQVNRAMELALNGSNYAKAAIDIAAWDVAGKSYGRRVCDLLGGATGPSIPSYYAISVASPEEQARVAREKQLEGFTRLQFKIGGGDIEADVEMLHRVKEVLEPGTRIAADANRSMTARDTLFLSQRCRDISMVIEQPTSTLEEIVAIRDRLCHPVYLDEVTEDVNFVIRAVGEGVADGFGMKLTRMGGISAMQTVRDICRARNLPHTSDDNWGGDIIAAACVHVGATVEPRLFEGTWIAAPYIDGHYDDENSIFVENGRIRVPLGHGLGIVPDVSKFGAPIMTFG
jgi:L-alanine-DL-glutamate epimerase-like enolase superfamily enzyme